MLSEPDYRRRMFETVLTVTGVSLLLAVLWAAAALLSVIIEEAALHRASASSASNR